MRTGNILFITFLCLELCTLLILTEETNAFQRTYPVKCIIKIKQIIKIQEKDMNLGASQQFGHGSIISHLFISSETIDLSCYYQLIMEGIMF